MSYLDISGIYCPFTFEANVNVHMNDVLIPVTMCHELSHLSGYMREDEANFIAFLACLQSDDPEFRYSGVAGVRPRDECFAHCGQRPVEPGGRFKATHRAATFGQQCVLEAVRNARFRGSDRVNDAYLKANG